MRDSLSWPSFFASTEIFEIDISNIQEPTSAKYNQYNKNFENRFPNIVSLYLLFNLGSEEGKYNIEVSPEPPKHFIIKSKAPEPLS